MDSIGRFNNPNINISDETEEFLESRKYKYKNNDNEFIDVLIGKTNSYLIIRISYYYEIKLNLYSLSKSINTNLETIDELFTFIKNIFKQINFNYKIFEDKINSFCRRKTNRINS